MSRKKDHLIIDEHVHVGSEVGCSENMRNTMIGIGLHDYETILGLPAHTAANEPMRRKYFVDAGRWDKKYLDLSLLPPLTIEDFIYYMDDVGLDKAVLLGRDYQQPWPPYTHVVTPAEYVKSCVDKAPDKFIGIAGINAHEVGVASKIKYYVEDLHMKGVGEIYTPTGIWPDDKEKCYPIYEKCVEYDIPVFIHLTRGDSPATGLMGRVWYQGRALGDPRSVEPVGYDFPDLKIMMHSGRPGNFVALLCKFFPNMMTQIGGWYVRFQDPLHAKVAKDWALWCQENIPDKVVFGSDYPHGFPQMKTAEWYMDIPELTDEFKKKLFETNVRRFYKF